MLSIITSNNREEFNLQLKNLLEYLKDDSGLPLADLEDFEFDLKKLDTKYQNGNDTFLWVYSNKFIYYGTWDEMYSVYWSRVNNGIRNFINAREGFKDFICNDDEIMQSKGVFIITENPVLMKQIDILMKKADPVV